jgi:uncharacterized protein
MLLDVTQALKAPGSTFDFSLSQEWNSINAGGEQIRFDEPVRAEGHYVYTGETILINGTLDAHYVASCSRCLTDVPSELSADFSEEFAKVESEEYPDRYLYQGDKINLDTMIEDLIVLNTPMRHLCNESCRGLCPECGADLNKERCRCLGGPDGETPTAF